MRRQLVSTTFAALVVLLALPMVVSASPDDDARDRAAASTVAVQHLAVPSVGIRDEAAMVLVGTALIGLAAAVRRAS